MLSWDSSTKKSRLSREKTKNRPSVTSLVVIKAQLNSLVSTMGSDSLQADGMSIELAHKALSWLTDSPVSDNARLDWGLSAHSRFKAIQSNVCTQEPIICHQLKSLLTDRPKPIFTKDIPISNKWLARLRHASCQLMEAVMQLKTQARIRCADLTLTTLLSTNECSPTSQWTSWDSLIRCIRILISTMPWNRTTLSDLVLRLLQLLADQGRDWWIRVSKWKHKKAWSSCSEVSLWSLVSIQHTENLHRQKLPSSNQKRNQIRLSWKTECFLAWNNSWPRQA